MKKIKLQKKQIYEKNKITKRKIYEKNIKL